MGMKHHLDMLRSVIIKNHEIDKTPHKFFFLADYDNYEISSLTELENRKIHNGKQG